MLEHALRYARLGWRVLPIAPGGKRPIIKNWRNLATTDEATIREWWKTVPNANIGILIEGDSETVVLDVEGPNGHDVSGIDAWIDIAKAAGFNGDFPTQRTPSTGMHILGRRPDEIERMGRRLAPGIEIFGGGGSTKQIVVGPSEASGASYEWTLDLDVGPEDLPEFPASIFLGMEVEPETEQGPPRVRDAFDDAVDAYNAQNPLTLPRGTRRVACPVCASERCWGRLAARDDRWCCWSETHKVEWADVGRKTSDGDAMYGDALDLAVARSRIAGEPKTRKAVLIDAGLLRETKPQIDRYARPEDDGKMLARVFVHGMHEDPVGYVTPEQFAERCLDEVPDDVIYRKDGILRTMGEDDDMPILDPKSMVNILGRYVSLLDTSHRTKKPKVVLSRWTQGHAASVIARATLGHENVRPLIERTRMPMPVMHDGAIVFLQPGYNRPGYLLDRDEPIVPIMNRDEIYQVMREIVRTFPFGAYPGEYSGNSPFSSEANALAHMLTIYVRPLIDGPTPMFTYMAPSPGTGKTTLAQSVTMAAAGVEPLLGPIPTKSDKFIDTVTATLARPGVPSYVWDNVRSDEPFEHQQLDSLITGKFWADRAKYDRESANFKNRVVWSATIQTGTSVNRDLASRAVGIYLDAKTDDPEGRRFDRDPITFAGDQHDRVCAAMMGAVSLWDAAGRPSRPQAFDHGSRFGEWNRIVPGILYVVDEMLGSHVNANHDAFARHAHENDDPWTILTGVWIEKHDGRAMKSSDLLKVVINGNDLELGAVGDDVRRLGRFLAKHEGWRVGDRKYVRTQRGGTMWHELRAV